MIAHTLGNPFDLKAVKAFCDKHGLWLVEDNCDALGSEIYDRRRNKAARERWGDIGTASFYPPHHMTMGEGGSRLYGQSAACTSIDALSYRDWGRDCILPFGSWTTFAGTALTDSTASCRWATTINMFIQPLWLQPEG